MLNFHPLLPVLSTRATNHFHFDAQLLFILKEEFILLLFCKFKEKITEDSKLGQHLLDLAPAQTVKALRMM